MPLTVVNVNPTIEKFSDFLYKKPFVIHSLGKQTYSENNVCNPLLQELGISHPIHLHVVDWHETFDALLGSENLKTLGAKIDYQNYLLEISNITVPFFRIQHKEN